MTSTSRTARCGSACPVVWQGRNYNGCPLCRFGPGKLLYLTCQEYSSLNINARVKFAPLVRELFPQNEQSIIFDNSRLEQSSFDVAYLTELNPMWHDDD